MPNYFLIINNKIKINYLLSTKRKYSLTFHSRLADPRVALPIRELWGIRRKSATTAQTERDLGRVVSDLGADRPKIDKRVQKKKAQSYLVLFIFSNDIKVRESKRRLNS